MTDSLDTIISTQQKLFNSFSSNIKDSSTITYTSDFTAKVPVLGTILQSSLNNANQLMSIYNDAVANKSNAEKLYDVYRNDNKQAENKIEDNYSDALTNERKAFYETQEQDTLKFYYSMFWWIYYIIVLVYISSLLFTSKVSIIGIVILLTVFTILPYLIRMLTWVLLWIWLFLRKLLPTNVYYTQ